jgi:hypothetical protein
MSPSRDHDVAETIHLTEQNFDEALVATQGLVMLDFWAGAARAGRSRRSSRRSPRPRKAG